MGARSKIYLSSSLTLVRSVTRTSWLYIIWGGEGLTASNLDPDWWGETNKHFCIRITSHLILYSRVCHRIIFSLRQYKQTPIIPSTHVIHNLKIIKMELHRYLRIKNIYKLSHLSTVHSSSPGPSPVASSVKLRYIGQQPHSREIESSGSVSRPGCHKLW